MATVAIEFVRPNARGRVPSMGSTATSTSGPLPLPTTSPLKSIGRVVLLALSNDDDPLDIDGLQDSAHGIYCGGIGGFLVAAAHETAGRKRGCFRDAHEVETKVSCRCDVSHASSH